MVAADDCAIIKGAPKSTVDFPLDFLDRRLMANSMRETGANRTFMLVVGQAASGLPFECAHPIVIGV